MFRLTRESDILAEQQKKEESKLATYAAVEKTLNEISSQMGLAVMPQVDQSTLRQQDCKKTIAENNETVNRLCKEVVQHFLVAVNGAVDKHLHTALQKIRDEADHVSKDIQKRNSQSGGDASRWEGIQRSRMSQDLDKGAFRTKKRRMYTPSPYPQRRRSASKERFVMSTQTSSQIMKELEAKVERQAQALINLEKENDKVRHPEKILASNILT